jgi:mannose-6-phosphate isomerase-like protein (cupin superfamily)
MAQETGWTQQAMQARLVRYADLVPGLNAFVDTRNPGSEAKENFTIIGPGVAENPNAHVHIREPHGFNIGAARQPPRCINSQHSHTTAEVFVVFSGQWRFTFGEHGTDGAVEGGPGTIGSVPTGMFRGFENIGTEPGFLWVALGGDDPGHVLWAPSVFDMAEKFGLKLLADGTLLDTAAGETLAPGAELMPRTSAEQVAARPTPPADRLERCFARPGDAPAAPRGPLSAPGLVDEGIIGLAGPGGPAGPIGWPHGFHMRRLTLDGGTSRWHSHAQAEVLFVGQGEIHIDWPDGSLALGAGDTLTVPRGLHRRFRGHGTLILVRGGDEALLPDWRP